MKFDEIVEHLGEFGLYQKRLYFLACLPAIPCAIQVLVSVFVLSIPHHRCRLPNEYNDTSYQPNSYINQLYVNHSIPMDDDGKWSQCQRYDVNMTDITEESVININASKTDCNKWVYDTTTFKNTFITEKNMICENSMYRSHANMVMMFGIMIGSICFGIISDVFGRKVCFVVGVVLQVTCTIATVFSPGFILFIILRFFIGASVVGSYFPVYILGIELVGKSKRTFAGMVINVVWSGGYYILGLMAYFLRDWKHLQIAITIPVSLLIILFRFIPESPRWLISRGRTKQAEEIIREAARVNKVELPDTLFDVDTLDDGPQVKVWEMFTSPVLFFRCIIIFFNWIVVTMVYFGLSLNVGNLAGDIYVNFLLSSIVESVAYILCIFLLDRWGRKVVHCSSMLLGGIACLFSIFPIIYGDKSHGWITIVLSMIGKLGASAAFGVIYVFTTELFPTVIRNSGLGISSFTARFGAIISSYIAELGTIVKGDIGTAMPLLVFGGASVVAGLLSLCLPETLNKNLPETIEDAKQFGRKSADLATRTEM